MYTVTNSVLTVLPMGQGACNLIEIYGRDSNNTSDPEKLIYLGMVDCGSDDSKEETYIEYSYQYLKERMLKRGTVKYGPQTTSQTPYIDTLILTHRDADHHNKFKFLEEYLSQTAILVEEDDSASKTKAPKTKKTLRKGNVKQKVNANNDKSEATYVLYKGSRQHKAIFRKGGNIRIDRSYVLIAGDLSIRLNKYKNSYKVKINKDKEQQLKNTDTSKVLSELVKLLSNTYNNQIKEDIKSGFEDIMDPKINYDYVNNNVNNPAITVAPPVVGTSYYGGENSDKSFSLFNDATKNAIYMPISTNGTTVSIDNVTGANVHLISTKCDSIVQISNHTGSPENRASIVSLWDTGKGKYLMTGDATVETMAHLNNISDKTKYVDANVMTAPHHGADLTSRGHFKTKGVDVDNKWQIYSGFLSKYKPQGVAISAGYDNKHGHPGRNFLDVTYCYFKNNNKVNETEHSIYANLDKTVENDKKNYGLYKTRAPIYSILQKNDAGNLYFRLLKYKGSNIPEDGHWTSVFYGIQGLTEDDSSTTDCKNIKTKQSPFDYRKNNKNSCKSPAAAVDLPRAVKRGRAS